MIKNFKEITAELSKLDKQLIPFYVDFFREWVGNEFKTSRVIVLRLNLELKFAEIDNIITGVKLRKIVNYIRSKALLSIIATSKGYTVSYDLKTVESQIESMNNRINAERNAVKGLEIIREEIINGKQNKLEL